MDSESIMITVVFIAVSLLISAVGVAFAAAGNKRTREALRSLAPLLGLVMEEAGSDPVSSGSDAYGSLGSGQGLATNGFIDVLKKIFSNRAAWRLTGSVGSARLAIHPETRSSGKSSVTYTVARANLGTSLSFDLRMGREGVFSKLGMAIGAIQDIEAGDAAFDKAVRVKSSDRDRAQSLISDSSVRDAMLKLLASSPDAYVTNQFIHWERRGVITDEVIYREMLDAMTAMANSLESKA